MSAKIKYLLFASGGIVFLAGAVFLWYSYFQKENSSAKEITADSPVKSKESVATSEQKAGEKTAPPENSQGVPVRGNPIKDVDELSSENNKKFDSEEDEEEETDDNISVEVESDDD